LTTLFLVFRDHGPGWVARKPTREQPLWDAHAAFMDRLFDEGRIVLAGPYADGSRALVVVAARDEAEARAIFADDPWTPAGILTAEEVVPWTIFLDSRGGP
jgi:hypothetical protein